MSDPLNRYGRQSLKTLEFILCSPIYLCAILSSLGPPAFYGVIIGYFVFSVAYQLRLADRPTSLTVAVLWGGGLFALLSFRSLQRLFKYGGWWDDAW